MVQWLRICLPMQGTRVWSLVGDLRSHVVQGQLNPQARTLSLRSLEQQKPVRCNRRKPTCGIEAPAQPGPTPKPRPTVPRRPQRTAAEGSCLISAPRMLVLLNTWLGPCESYNYSVFPIWLAVTKTLQSNWASWVNWYPGKFTTLILFPCTLS